MKFAIRIILTLILLYFIYGETGWATTTAIGLISIGNELSAYSIKTIVKAIKLLQKEDKFGST